MGKFCFRQRSRIIRIRLLHLVYTLFRDLTFFFRFLYRAGAALGCPGVPELKIGTATEAFPGQAFFPCELSVKDCIFLQMLWGREGARLAAGFLPIWIAVKSNL